MLNAFMCVLIVTMAVLFVSNAYAIWYAKSGRYDLDRRLDAAVRHKAR
ncbi:hypothetical protein [Candidatus Villigracilis affinis]|nr:hypothetical protein [Anaerolineales bacterium]